MAKLWELLQNQLYVLSEINVVNEQLMALTLNGPQCHTIIRNFEENDATDRRTQNGFDQILATAPTPNPIAIATPSPSSPAIDDEDFVKIVRHHSEMKVRESHQFVIT